MSITAKNDNLQVNTYDGGNRIKSTRRNISIGTSFNLKQDFDNHKRLSEQPSSSRRTDRKNFQS